MCIRDSGPLDAEQSSVVLAMCAGLGSVLLAVTSVVVLVVQGTSLPPRATIPRVCARASTAPGVDDDARQATGQLLRRVLPSRPVVPVSYTHLRAHETDSYLVCRLL